MEITSIRKTKKYWSKELFQVISLSEEETFIGNAEVVKTSKDEILLLSGEDSIEIDYSNYPGIVTFYGLAKDIILNAKTIKGNTFKLKEELKMFGFKWNQKEAIWERVS